MNTQKSIYWIATGLLSLMILGSATLYFVQTEEIAKVFKLLGYPTHLIIPIAIAKILGILTFAKSRAEISRMGLCRFILRISTCSFFSLAGSRWKYCSINSGSCFAYDFI